MPETSAAVYHLYEKWLDVGRSNLVVGIVSSAAMADFLHSAGLMKDSMYDRIGTFLNVAFSTDQIGVVFTAGAQLRSLVEGDEDRDDNGEEEGYSEEQVLKLVKLAGLAAEAAV